MAEEAVEIVKMDATANDVPPQFEVKVINLFAHYPISLEDLEVKQRIFKEF